MPFGTEPLSPGTGLALSGGGFRAMLFHVGAVWRINELGLLRGLRRVSSVSGGSLFAGALAVRWKRLDFEADVARNYRDLVAGPVMRFASRCVGVTAILKGLVPSRGPARAAADAYSEGLVGGHSLRDLADESAEGDDRAPRFVFNATHLGCGATWRFSKPYMGCSRIGLVRNPDVRVAVAMAASAAFPPLLSPLRLRLEPGAVERFVYADLYDETAFRRVAILTDGGVYDNLGLDTVWLRFQTVLCSDASRPMDRAPGRFRIPGSELLRTLSIAHDQAQRMRLLGLVVDLRRPDRDGALWRIAMRPDECAVASPFPVDPEWPEYFSRMRSRLDPISEPVQRKLVNWGYVTSDRALRSSLARGASAPTSLPFPGDGFEDAPPRWRH